MVELFKTKYSLKMSIAKYTEREDISMKDRNEFCSKYDNKYYYKRKWRFRHCDMIELYKKFAMMEPVRLSE